MNIYLLSPDFHRNLNDVSAAVELLKELYQAESRGRAPMVPGLLYATPTPIPEGHHEILGIVPWI